MISILYIFWQESKEEIDIFSTLSEVWDGTCYHKVIKAKKE